MEEAPRSYKDLMHDSMDVVEATQNDDYMRSLPNPLPFQVARLARQVAELAQRLSGDTEVIEFGDTDDDAESVLFEFVDPPKVVVVTERPSDSSNEHTVFGGEAWIIDLDYGYMDLYNDADECRAWAFSHLCEAFELARTGNIEAAQFVEDRVRQVVEENGDVDWKSVVDATPTS